MTGRLILFCFLMGLPTAALSQSGCFGWAGHFNVGYPGLVEAGGGFTLGSTYTNSGYSCTGMMFDASVSPSYAKGTFGWRHYEHGGLGAAEGYDFGIVKYSDTKKADAQDMNCVGVEGGGGFFYMQARGGVIRCPDGIKPVFMVGLFY